MKLQAVIFPQNFANPTATLSQSLKHNWVALPPVVVGTHCVCPQGINQINNISKNIDNGHTQCVPTG